MSVHIYLGSIDESRDYESFSGSQFAWIEELILKQGAPDDLKQLLFSAGLLHGLWLDEIMPSDLRRFAEVLNIVKDHILQLEYSAEYTKSRIDLAASIGNVADRISSLCSLSSDQHPLF